MYPQGKILIDIILNVKVDAKDKMTNTYMAVGVWNLKPSGSKVMLWSSVACHQCIDDILSQLFYNRGIKSYN
jgi:hypothetical protein